MIHEKRPETRPQAQARSVATGHPTARAVQRRVVSVEHPAAATVPLGGPTGQPLPVPLRHGIEAMSGVDMADVRVHRQSQHPAAIGALAYAQGRDIHLAPGQDRHLPHEAWHIVQQKQGRVATTGTTANGTPLNDDTALEREADSMGSRAQDPRAVANDTNAATRGPSAQDHQAPAQRQIKIYNNGKSLTKKELTAVKLATKMLDRAVEDAVALIDADPQLSKLKTQSGYIKQWRQTFAELLKTGALPEFFFARYGYAVETLAAASMKKKIGGLTIKTQVSKGATRPDFVITNSDDEELAWLDITAYASKGHIFKKQHSGWASRPFVAEILYDAPTISSLGKGKLTKEQKKILANITEAEIQAEEDYDQGIDEIKDAIQSAMNRSYREDGQLTVGRTKIVVKAALDELFNNISMKDAGEMFNLVEQFDLNGTIESGSAWSKWAFKTGGYASGRALAIALGKLRREEFDA